MLLGANDFLLITENFSGDNIEKIEKSRACSAYEGRKAYRILLVT